MSDTCLGIGAPYKQGVFLLCGQRRRGVENTTNYKQPPNTIKTWADAKYMRNHTMLASESRRGVVAVHPKRWRFLGAVPTLGHFVFLLQ